VLYAARVSEQLASNLDRFRAFAEEERAVFRSFDRVLAEIDLLDRAEIEHRLEDARPAGALPGEEWDSASGMVIAAGLQFAHHRAAREWALERIRGVRTVSVDGSEIKPTKDYSLPVAAVQIAWFENPHDATERYVKDVAFQILNPDELTREGGDGFGMADQILALRRFRGEVDVLIERVRAIAARGWSGPTPVAFFDGSLVVSFAAAMLERIGGQYIDAIGELLDASETTGIPIVGFVDTSLARDVSTMLAHLGELPSSSRLPDSRLLDSRMAWGDRTRALICARDDVLGRYHGADGRSFARELCFTYLKTNQFAPPARLDIPRWVVRAGLLDHVVDVVRAEVIVGNGYPYGIEAADACAVLGTGDRERFYRLIQDFAGHNGIDLRIVPKAASKRRRRV
jgi:hypothetical protein